MLPVFHKKTGFAIRTGNMKKRAYFVFYKITASQSPYINSISFFQIYFFTQKNTKKGFSDMLPSYRTMKYKSPIWGYFHVQKE